MLTQYIHAMDESAAIGDLRGRIAEDSDNRIVIREYRICRVKRTLWQRMKDDEPRWKIEYTLKAKGSFESPEEGPELGLTKVSQRALSETFDVTTSPELQPETTAYSSEDLPFSSPEQQNSPPEMSAERRAERGNKRGIRSYFNHFRGRKSSDEWSDFSSDSKPYRPSIPSQTTHGSNSPDGFVEEVNRFSSVQLESVSTKIEPMALKADFETISNSDRLAETSGHGSLDLPFTPAIQETVQETFQETEQAAELDKLREVAQETRTETHQQHGIGIGKRFWQWIFRANSRRKGELALLTTQLSEVPLDRQENDIENIENDQENMQNNQSESVQENLKINEPDLSSREHWFSLVESAFSDFDPKRR